MSDVVLPCILACVCEKWEYEEVSDQGLAKAVCQESSCPSGELASATNRSRAEEGWLLSCTECSHSALPEVEQELSPPSCCCHQQPQQNWAELTPSPVNALLWHGSFHPAYALTMNKAAELHPEVTFQKEYRCRSIPQTR